MTASPAGPGNHELVDVFASRTATPLAAEFLAGAILACIRSYAAAPERRAPAEVAAELAILVGAVCEPV